MDECPICLDELSTSQIAILDCCKKEIHVNCLVRCMSQSMTCPMCRARHQSLQCVPDVESQVLIVSPPRNDQFFKSFVLLTIAVSCLIIFSPTYKIFE